MKLAFCHRLVLRYRIRVMEYGTRLGGTSHKDESMVRTRNGVTGWREYP